jgi:hypothetical protein
MIEVFQQDRPELTLFKCTGRVLSTDIEESIRAFYQGKPSQNVVWDISDAEISELSATDVRSIAETTKQLAHSRPGGKTAIVSAADMPFGLARMYQAFAELAEQKSHVEVFRSREEALAWISFSEPAT